MEGFFMKLVFFLVTSLIYAQITNPLSSFSPKPVEPIWQTHPLGNGRALVEVTIPIPQGMHLDLNLEVLNLEIGQLPGGAGVENLTWSTPGLREGIPSFTEKAVLSRVIYGLEKAITVEAQVSWQICNEEGLCLLPEQASTQLLVDPGPFIWSEFLLYLLFAFLGGILLNFMPCILPLLSIKALQLNQASGESFSKKLNFSLSYTLGILSAMLLFATLLMVARSFGQMAGWGMHLQNPSFVLASSALLWALALSLWGLYTIPAIGLKSSNQTSLGSFLTGLGAVFVAAPCTAPFLGAAMSFALALPSLVIPVFFSATALGFALPFVLLSLIPQLKAIFPKPGAWMDLFEKILGFVLAGFSLYLLSSLFTFLDASSIALTLAYLFGLSFLIFLMGRLGSLQVPTLQRHLVWGIGFGLVVVGFGFAQQALTLRQNDMTQEVTNSLEDGWQPFSLHALDRARLEGRPVFVDIWAEWCSNCKLNHATVFANKDLIVWMDARSIVRLKGNFTTPNPEIQEWLRANRRVGLPVYAYYPPLTSGPIFLPEVLTVDLVKTTISNLDPKFEPLQ
jgi:thiol:disulfide interchange protein DsbD